MSSAIHSILIFLLATLCAGSLLYALLEPRIKHATRVKSRLRLAAGGASHAARNAGVAAKPRKRSVEDTLKQIKEKQKEKEKGRRSSSPSLTGRLRQSGLEWGMRTYLGVCIAVGVTAQMLMAFAMGLNSLAALVPSMIAGVLLPHLYLNHKRNKRLVAFRGELPNAVDVIVRGVRSGLPLGDCLRVIAAEGQEPVRSEFKGIVDDQTLGVPVQDALMRLAERVPIPETSFLATVVAIQSQSGGNLTEALANLSSVLRERKKIREKIKAFSSEAKASAGIIGALPPAVAGILYLTSPQYISLLFTTTLGQVVLAGCAIWMSIGVLIMRSMINFDF
ncbi:pilus assembly protein [Paracoccus sp. S-4012]|uniref:type II secretion system F family protein n=1 Tax=Paracoccus sp. S-4012 TaxID=2665648 RepID=UPI0012AFABA4|nr:type II secretion system F family protein [Paracoccus sp. S-4012]MRX51754.1 pilus assembly protein [Paracoccus sp. S-4012]